jgi:hypothetical protein
MGEKQVIPTKEEAEIAEVARRNGFDPVAVRLNLKGEALNTFTHTPEDSIRWRQKTYQAPLEYGKPGKTPQFYALGNHEVKVSAGDGNNQITLQDLFAEQVTTGNGNNTITLKGEITAGPITTGNGRNTVIIDGKFAAHNDREAAIKLGSGNDTIILKPGANINLPNNFVRHTDSNNKPYRGGSGYMNGQAYIDGGKGVDTIVFPAGVKRSDVQPFTWSPMAHAPDYVGLKTPNGDITLMNVERAVIEGKTYAIGLKVTSKSKGDGGYDQYAATLTPLATPKKAQESSRATSGITP